MKKIIFNDRYGLTQAVIEGRKTVTRRTELDSDSDYIARHYNPKYNPQHNYYRDSRGMCQLINCDTGKLFIPRYKLGEVVAVAQSYKTLLEQEGVPFEKLCEGIGANDIKWYNKMFVCADLMPHQIRITGIRVERLQDITDEECMREGIMRTPPEMGRAFYFCNNECLYDSPREAIAVQIGKMSGRGTWERNPWVVAYEFELVK